MIITWALATVAVIYVFGAGMLAGYLVALPVGNRPNLKLRAVEVFTILLWPVCIPVAYLWLR